MVRLLKSLFKSVGPIRQLVAERDELASRLERLAPGHFYSTIPNMDDVRRDAPRIFDRSLREIPGVDLNIPGQLALLAELGRFYAELPFSEHPREDARYYFANEYFSYADAIFLYGVMRWSKPRRIVEIGSGFSSFVMLDTNDRFFGGDIRFTFIEPHAERLRSRLAPGDARSVEIIEQPVQAVDLSRFGELGDGDILFVDSSHVAKVGSDLNTIVFDILPSLRKGVLVHFHDVFYPFEYPQALIENGWYWNEDYLLRAFLQFNAAFGIRIWNDFLARFHPETLAQVMPLCMKDTGGGLWIQRL